MAVLTVLGLAAASCVGPEQEPGVHALALDAYCSAHVNGTGDVDVENDYLPHVVQCENGGAGFEALKAQAVAARSYLYYKLETSGAVNDGQSDQVYSCGRTPSADHLAAVDETSGVFLSFADNTVAAFYVAGAFGTPPDCVGDGNDPTSTERWVTYNEGLSGDDIEQTPLGWVDPANTRNRGCMSQNGADCLSESGRSHEEILRFYYGADIGIEQAEGDCVLPLLDDPEEDEPDPGADTDSDTGSDTGPNDIDAGDPEPDTDTGTDTPSDGHDSGEAVDDPDYRHSRADGLSTGCSVATTASTGGWMLVLVLLPLVSAGRRRTG